MYREEYEDRPGIAALCEGALRRIFLAEECERTRRQPERTFGYRHGGDRDTVPLKKTTLDEFHSSLVATVTMSGAVPVLDRSFEMAAEQVRSVSRHDVKETWKQSSWRRQRS